MGTLKEIAKLAAGIAGGLALFHNAVAPVLAMVLPSKVAK